MTIEEINQFVENQLSIWPEAKAAYDNLRRVKRRSLGFDGMDIAVQFNPARIKSTGAMIDNKSIESRPCFLCRQNRPDQQLVYPLISGWDMLVNPYPILPIHFTIVSSRHIPQSLVPVDIITMAELLRGMTLFFNGAKAGASAPDHLHVQAVIKDELPLLRMIEKMHVSDKSSVITSSFSDKELPFYFISGIICKDENAEKILKIPFSVGGIDAEGKLSDLQLVNIFFWIDCSSRLRYVVIPRKSHRPSCFFMEGEDRIMISPGCIDMAGLIITPRKDDFDKLSYQMARKIYSEVALPFDYL